MQYNLPSAIHEKCSELLGTEIKAVSYVGGGDINQARLIETGRGQFFVKLNTLPFSGWLFETEAKGLSLLAATETVRTPEVIGSGDTSEGAFLLLEYIETGYRSQDFWEDFGRSLAEMHRHSADSFGLDTDNFIGSLPQTNFRRSTWPEFFVQERLQPQMDLAEHKFRLNISDFKSFEKLFPKIPDICPEEPPALTHGDLWSGNFMVDNTGKPVLIDPSVSYAHREMDLAMSRLFGGFERDFYRSYEEAYPLAPGFEQRLPVYQLYYLLVHVNLFGGAYAGSVRSILSQFV